MEIRSWISGGGVKVISPEQLNPPYTSGTDAFIWAIGSPEKLQSCMKDTAIAAECLLLWNMGLWKEEEEPSVYCGEYDEVSELFCDEYSRKVFQSYLEAWKGKVDNDILFSINGTYFNELTKSRRTGAFVDCGSYDGQSAIDYMKFIGEECLVYAFEPDKDNYRNLADRMKNRSNVICLNKGCYSCERELSFASNGDMTSSLQETGKEYVEVTTIDNVVGDEKVAFIKMDIEGAELEALKGAKKVIERDMPVLAISAYHRQEDLFMLVPYISNLKNENEKYNLYLRHHSVVQSELIIYAIPVKYSS